MQGEAERAALPAAFTPRSTTFRCRFDRLGDPQTLNVYACCWFDGRGRSSKQSNAASFFLGQYKGLTLEPGYFEGRFGEAASMN